jgi:hypothetical protein
MHTILKIIGGLLEGLLTLVAIIFAAPNPRDDTPVMGRSGMRDPLNVHDEMYP